MVHQHASSLATGAGNPALHHIALVVSDLDAAAERYRTLGFQGSERFVIPEQGIEAIIMQSGHAWVELIRPTDADGPIARFLAKRGEGIHHVAYAVPELAAALAKLEAAGVRLIDHTPRSGLHGWQMAFIHPESCSGVLTELVQE
jgi:methylmalonyl-CoA/ethylmalonyl-CoA epimerase